MSASPYMSPFHDPYPGMPKLFHTYCPDHPDWGTCSEEAQAHRDIAEHLEQKHGEES